MLGALGRALENKWTIKVATRRPNIDTVAIHFDSVTYIAPAVLDEGIPS